MSSFRFRGQPAKRVFEDSFSAGDIAVSLASFDYDSPVSTVLEVMKKYDYRIAGIRIEGRISGYVLVNELVNGVCGEAIHSFNERNILPSTASLSDVVLRLSESEQIFISVFGEVNGILTKSDLQKPPVRMWLFGLITASEMVMTRLVEHLYPDEGWKEKLPSGRLKNAEKLQAERKRRNRESDLLSCLQFSDKGQLLAKKTEFMEMLELRSVMQARKQLKLLESLRNNLAHSQDIVTHDWPTIVRLAENLDKSLSMFRNLAKGIRSSDF